MPNRTAMASRGLLFALLFLLSAIISRGGEPPNIVFILADDLGYGDLSCYGGKIPTPNLDRMAAEGARFTQAYVASPICSPSRAALITGQHPARWRITSYLQTRKGNRACDMADYLDPDAPSLPRALKAAGYRTAHIGKWHLGGGRDVTNAPSFSAYGYDMGLGTYESPEPHPDITATNWIWSPQDPVRRWDRTKWMAEKALEFLKKKAGKPAFINLWLDDTHTPWVPSEDQESVKGPERDNRRNFRKVLVEMDRQIGKFMEEVRQLKNGRETLVIFMGDNGPLPTFNQTRTGGMRGSKLSLYEGGIREPLIVWWPGKVPAGRVDHTSVISSLDFFPTLTKIAGAGNPEGFVLEGDDMSGVFFGKSGVRTGALYWEYGRNEKSFSYPKGPNRSPNLAMRRENWKYLVRDDGSGGELYDLGSDADEKNNVAERKPKLAKQMRQELLNWRKTLPESKE